jgi:hypothetical protein
VSKTDERRGRRAAIAWTDAVTGGSFYTRWSALLSLLVAATISVPIVGETSPAGYARAVVVATVAWIPLAVLVLPAAFAERRLRSRPARAVVVLSALLIVAVVRAPVNDAVSVWIWGIGTTGSFGPRTATNILTALVLFSVVGIATSQYAQRRLTTRRLTDALAVMRARLRSAEQQVAVTRGVLARTGSRLRTARDDMLRGTVDFDAVRAYADLVRTASHDLAERRQEVVEAVVVPPPVATPERRRRLRERLAPTPWLSATLVYGTAAAPFALAAVGPVIWLAGVAGIAAADLVAGILLRRLPRGRHATVGAAAFLGIWIGVGAVVAGVTFLLVPGIGMLGLVGFLAVPAAAVTISLCTDAVQRARAEERRSAKLLARVARYVADTGAQSLDALRDGSDLLHGRVQGRCVILAAHADENPPHPDEIALFRSGTDEAFDRLASGAVTEDAATAPGSAVDRMRDAWRSVLAVDVSIAPAAAAALADHPVAERAADAMNEALVNAVKHSTARAARAHFDVASGGSLSVRVSSRGSLPAVADRSAGLGSRAADVRISQEGDDVVFEAHLPHAARSRALDPVPTTGSRIAVAEPPDAAG